MKSLLNSRVEIFRAETVPDGRGGFLEEETFIDSFFCEILLSDEKLLILSLRFHPEIKKELHLLWEGKKYRLVKLRDLKNGLLKLWLENIGALNAAKS